MSPSYEDRRSALAKLVTAGIGVITAALAGLVGVVASPRMRGEARRWRPAISTLEMPPDGPATAVLADRHADGWYVTRKQSIVFIDREGDGYRAMSAICAHLGCRVNWDATAKQFKCPCHGGVYDREGNVVAGPPPGPLARYAVRVNPQTSQIEVEL